MDQTGNIGSAEHRGRAALRWALSLLPVALAAAALAPLLHGKEPDDGPTLATAEFRTEAPAAAAVSVTGDFNQWDPAGLPLARGADGAWSRTVTLRDGQTCRYAFVIDGVRGPVGELRFYARGLPWYLSAWFWYTLGGLGQAVFAARFLLQWVVSERRGQSVIPVPFWWFSIAGSLIVLAYAIWRKDPIFILGQSTGCIVYVRNLLLLHRRKGDSARPSPLEGGALHA
jgi:lipid-A-disaccharide synthase-like uncharacterized protein